MNNLQIFESPEFGQVRTIDENGNILFCGNDVAKALGYSIPRKAITDHCKGVLKRNTLTNGGNQQLSYIPESDLYRLIVKSELPSAEKFEKWVFDEVLPTIRKHGGYLTPEKLEEVLLNPDTLITLAQNLKAEQERNKLLTAKVAEDKPKVLFAEAVATSQSTILVGQLAKLLKQNGIDIGQNRLFEWLRQNGYLIRQKGNNYNLPTQRAMDLGLFRIKESTHLNGDGVSVTTKTTKVTGKGQQYFIEKFLSEKTA